MYMQKIKKLKQRQENIVASIQKNVWFVTEQFSCIKSKIFLNQLEIFPASGKLNWLFTELFF